MASLRETQRGNFLVCFRHHGQPYQRALKTKDPTAAKALKGRIEHTIYRLSAGEMSRRELLDVLEERKDLAPADVLPYVLALRDSADREARAVAEQWLSRFNQDELEWEQRSMERETEGPRERMLALRHRTPSGEQDEQYSRSWLS